MKYLAVLERALSNYGGFVPDVPGATGIADTREATIESLAEGLALAIQDLAERGLPVPPPSDRADLNLDEYEPEEPYEIVSVSPAPMNPVSLEIESAMDSIGITQAELARKMGVSRSVASRITDPFYFGHSVRTLRRVADALGVDLEIRLAAAP
ncbi:MAG: type II toxin-antitoxin system HicB family antitoxin [Trueperaceae bacterium]